MSITNKKKVLHSKIKEIILLVRNFCKLPDIRKVRALSFQAEVENDNFFLVVYCWVIFIIYLAVFEMNTP